MPVANDIWSKAKALLSPIAGIAANAFLPGSGGFAAALVSKTLGVDNTPEAITAALENLKPEQIVALKEMEMKHETQLVSIAAELERAYLADRQSARQREISIVQATGKKDINLYILAWTVIVGFFLLIWFMTTKTLPPENVGPINQLFGALSAGFGMVLSYFYGSNKMQEHTTNLLAQAQPIGTEAK